MLGSALVRDPKFQDRVVAETRALLSTIPGQYGETDEAPRSALRSSLY